VSVLKGEGKVPILFGSTSIAAGSRTRVGYLARPDLSGEWPTILLIHSLFGISSSIKDIARRLARQGFAVVAVDLFSGRGPKRGSTKDEFVAAIDVLSPPSVDSNLQDVVGFIRNPAGFWSSAEISFGLLAIGAGVRFAGSLVAETELEGIGLAYAPLTDAANQQLAAFSGPILAVWGSEDQVADLDTARRLHELHHRTEIVMYGNVGHAFLDDSHADYDGAAAADALDRFAEFFSKLLPPPPA